MWRLSLLGHGMELGMHVHWLHDNGKYWGIVERLYSRQNIEAYAYYDNNLDETTRFIVLEAQ